MPDVAGDAEGALHREVRFGDVTYGFHIGRGASAWDELDRRLRALDVDRFVLVADRGVPEASRAELEAHLRAVAPTLALDVAADEKVKRLATIDDLAERAIVGGATRRSCVVALGGGVAGNIGGLLAALLYRGIRLVHVPTTLLGISDSVLSMKQAVNSPRGKNHLGTFYPPQFVWSRLELLDSLPPDEIRSALCETIKNVLAICPERYDELAARLRPDGRYAPDTIAGFIALCVDAKTRVMRDDPHEKRDALVLEYGHTVGHAAELLSGGALRHGFAIGVGMLAAARIAVLQGHLTRADEDAHRTLLVKNGGPTALPAAIDADDLLRLVRLDNKRGYVRPEPGTCDFILLEGLGRPRRNAAGGLITQVQEAVVRAAVAELA